jgi:hypothetical protein
MDHLIPCQVVNHKEIWNLVLAHFFTKGCKAYNLEFSGIFQNTLVLYFIGLKVKKFMEKREWCTFRDIPEYSGKSPFKLRGGSFLVPSHLLNLWDFEVIPKTYFLISIAFILQDYNVSAIPCLLSLLLIF